jgi:ribosomal protein L37E
MKTTSHHKLAAIIIIVYVVFAMSSLTQDLIAQTSNRQRRSSSTPNPGDESRRKLESNAAPSQTTEDFPVPYMEDNSWHVAKVIPFFIIVFGFLIAGVYFIIRHSRKSRELLGQRSSGLARPLGGRNNSYLDNLGNSGKDGETHGTKSTTLSSKHGHSRGLNRQIRGDNTPSSPTTRSSPIVAVTQPKSRGHICCQQCGAPLESSARYCEACGFDLQKPLHISEQQPSAKNELKSHSKWEHLPIEERLTKLAELKVQGLIDDKEYTAKRQKILDEF